MIEKFNFYDIYGYLLPGLVLSALLGLPFGLVQHSWKISDLSSLSSAVAVLAFAYVLGHLLQTVAVNALPSQRKDPRGKPRFPADILLDPEDPTFTRELKKSLAEQVKSTFRIDVHPDVHGDGGEISRQHNDAFFLCRTALKRGTPVSYFEQFEGLYALMRGLAAAFGLGFAYLGGWGASLVKDDSLHELMLGVAPLGLVGATVTTLVLVLRPGLPRHQRVILEKTTLVLLLVFLFALGYCFGWRRLTLGDHALWIPLFSLAAMFAALRCFGSYKAFAQEFAKSVWRDFVVSQAVPANTPPEKRPVPGHP
jgi:hypothetical protein